MSAYSIQDEAPRILVVDDEKVIREILTEFLALEGYVVRGVADGESALHELERRNYNLVLSDLKMPDMGGIDLLERLTTLQPDLTTVIMTGFGTVETAIEAMKRGAYDYILKPFKIEDVVHIVERALERQRLQTENFRLKEAVSIYKISQAIAQSLSLERILDVILDAVLVEADADVASLWLYDVKRQQFVEKRHRYSERVPQENTGRIDINALFESHRQGVPVLAHGPRALKFFVEAPADKRLISFCSMPLQVHDRVIGFLNGYSYTRGQRFSEGQRKMLAVLASRAAVSIENAQLYENIVGKNRDLTLVNQTLAHSFRATVIGFAHALEESDKYTRGHSERVSFYSALTARVLSLPELEIERVKQAGLMHDIGKIGIRSEKLNKPGKLSTEEAAMFRTHPAKGKRILEPIPQMAELIPGAWCHHENWDGSGYPQGLAGDHIPLLGRIVAVADTYDAMTSDRAYRKAMRHDFSLSEIVRCQGAQFDPEIVDVFVRAIEGWRSEQLKSGASAPR